MPESDSDVSGLIWALDLLADSVRSDDMTLSSSGDLGYFEAMDDDCGEVDNPLGGNEVSSPGPRIPRMAVHKICVRREAPESSTTAGTSPARELVPRAVPPPPPQVGPTHLEVYGKCR